MRADPPEDHAEIVFRVRLDRQPADNDKTAPLLDLTADLVDDRLSGASRAKVMAKEKASVRTSMLSRSV